MDTATSRPAVGAGRAWQRWRRPGPGWQQSTPPLPGARHAGIHFLGSRPPLAGRECVSVSVSVLGVCGRRSPEPRDSSAPEQWSPAGRAWPGATSPVAGVARAGRGSWKGSELATASRAAGGEADASRGSGFPGGPGYRREK